MDELKNVRGIVVKYLQEHGYGGLCNDIDKSTACACMTNGTAQNARADGGPPLELMTLSDCKCDEDDLDCTTDCIPIREKQFCGVCETGTWLRRCLGPVPIICTECNTVSTSEEYDVRAGGAFDWYMLGYPRLCQCGGELLCRRFIQRRNKNERTKKYKTDCPRVFTKAWV